MYCDIDLSGLEVKSSLSATEESRLFVLESIFFSLIFFHFEMVSFVAQFPLLIKDDQQFFFNIIRDSIFVIIKKFKYAHIKDSMM